MPCTRGPASRAAVGRVGRVTDVLSTDQISALRDRVAGLMPGLRADLEALTRIPSVSLDAFDQAHVEAVPRRPPPCCAPRASTSRSCARAAAPRSSATSTARPGRRTVMLYAHHDVQPPGDEATVGQPALRADRARRAALRPRRRRRQGRHHGARRRAARARRGAARRASRSSSRARRRSGPTRCRPSSSEHGEKLRADAIVLADSTNWAIGEPALTTTLRGMIRVVVTVTTLDHGVHSGMFGGAVPDAAHRPRARAREPARRRRRRRGGGPEVGRGRRPRLRRGPACARSRGCSTGSRRSAPGRCSSRIWTKPSITTIGIDAPSVATASNTLVPRPPAKVSMRLAPDEHDLGRLRAAARPPRRAHAVGRPGRGRPSTTAGSGFSADAQGPVYDEARAAFHDAWGVEPVDIGRRRVDPVRRRLRRAVPGCRDPRHRCRGPRRARARRQRVAAPRRVREGLPGRGAAPGQAGRPPG